MKIGRTICFCILLASLLTLFSLSPVLAQDEEEKIELITSHYKLEIISGRSATFNLELNYQGDEARIFDLEATGPTDWETYITSSYGETKILDVRIEPPLPDETYSTERITVHIDPAYGLTPEPGEYQVTVEATSGEIKGTIQLTVVVTAKYTLYLVTPDGLLSTKANAGKDNYFSVLVANGGSAAIDDITFSSTNKPRGWTIEFSQDEISSLAAGDYRAIDLNIKPPSDAITGDYEIILKANGKQASADELKIRVTVKTSAIWGWVGVGIIILVIAGLAFIFMRFSRR